VPESDEDTICLGTQTLSIALGVRASQGADAMKHLLQRLGHGQGMGVKHGIGVSMFD
jgi:hypothetical protein